MLIGVLPLVLLCSTHLTASSSGLQGRVGEVRKEKKSRSQFLLRYESLIQGEVLDLFEDHRVLISFGSHHGASKGRRVFVDRLQPSWLPNLPPMHVPVAELELVSVAAWHSDAQIKSRASQMEVQIGDFAWVPRSQSVLQWLRETPPLPGVRERGGAIIDLTVPGKQE